MVADPRRHGPGQHGSMESLVWELAQLPHNQPHLPGWDDVSFDVDLIYRLFNLQGVVRFYGQRHWEHETELSSLQPGSIVLENVAAHSFHVARCASALAPHFSWIDGSRAIELALVHDEPELITGDKDPVGSDGQGTSTHAFSEVRRHEKEKEERIALELLAGSMRPALRERYKAMMVELIEESSPEAEFVKAIDKLQALAFVRLVKRGRITPEHMAFTLRYSRNGLRRFPLLQNHFMCIVVDLLNDVASESPETFAAFCQATRNKLDSVERK